MNQTNGWLGRRDLLKWLAASGLLVAAPMPAEAASSSNQALEQLMAGNQRFINGQSLHPAQSAARLLETAQTQRPFVSLLSCADSRVPAEIIFDQGLGDIFDVRVAGNLVTPEAVGSLEYAVAYLETPLLMVLGHERCGAVTAAVKDYPLPGQIGSLVDQIKPAIVAVKLGLPESIDQAVLANIQYQMAKLQQISSLITQQVKLGKLEIVGGRYDLDTGKVTLLNSVI